MILKYWTTLQNMHKIDNKRNKEKNNNEIVLS